MFYVLLLTKNNGMKISEFLEQPFYYFNDKRSKWIYIVSAVVFSHVFLLFFQPYGISEEMSNPANPTFHKFLFFFSIAISTFLALGLSQFILRQVFDYQKVNNKKYLYWVLFEALLLLAINFGLSFIIPDLGNDFEQELNIWFQLKMYPKVLMILLFPFLGSVVYVAITQMQSELQQRDDELSAFKKRFKNSNVQKQVVFYDENNQPDLKLSLEEILYLESSNQYVVVYYNKLDQVKKHIIRNRLKNIIAQTEDLPIEQCHRSYAVNVFKINNLNRDNGKLFLTIQSSNSKIKIPVSKSFSEQIKQEFKA